MTAQDSEPDMTAGSSPIIETKVCKKCQSEYSILDQDQKFYQKMDVPAPTFCPDCREQRRLVQHNERRLYRRTCDASGEQILSHFRPDAPRVVYKQKIWWSDSWDALSYGQSFDPALPFFEQFDRLQRKVPQVALFTDYLLDENSDFTNYAGRSKNCYLIAHADFNQDCYYGYGVKSCQNCCDIYNTVHCELCYECVDCYSCYNLRYGQDCFSCSDSLFLRDCVGCKNCFGCQNLRHKEYWIFNQKCSQVAYQDFLNQANLGSYSQLNNWTEQFRIFSSQQPHRNLHMLKTEACFGDQLVNCRNVTDSFEVSDMEDGRFCTQMKLGAKDCMDVHQFGSGAELMYDCVICGDQSRGLRFCSGCCSCADAVYCSNCFSSHDIFGCVSLRRKEYCILNKQYSKDDYFALIAQIKTIMNASGEWGEFFPAHLSPFSYYETRAAEFFPLSKDNALSQGFIWRDDVKPPQSPAVKFTIPDHINQVTDEITKQLLSCTISNLPYRISVPELRYYRQLNIPIPRYSPDQRFTERQNKRNVRKLWQRSCSNCKQQIVSSYHPDRSETVLCESCYENNLL